MAFTVLLTVLAKSEKLCTTWTLLDDPAIMVSRSTTTSSVTPTAAATRAQHCADVNDNERIDRRSFCLFYRTSTFVVIVTLRAKLSGAVYCYRSYLCVCVFATGGRAGGVRTLLQPARAVFASLWALFSLKVKSTRRRDVLSRRFRRCRLVLKLHRTRLDLESNPVEAAV